MNVAVLGANTRARAIARRCALSGVDVRLHASEATTVMDSVDIVEQQLDEISAHAVSDGRQALEETESGGSEGGGGRERDIAADDGESTVIDRDTPAEHGGQSSTEHGDAQSLTEHVEGTTSLEAAVADADVVIETTCSDASELQTRFSEVEALVGEETLVSTAVTEVSVTAAAAGLRHSERAVGFRFQESDDQFVEIVLGEATDSKSLARATEFVEGVAPAWVTVRDVPGAASTRLSLALETAAIRLLDEGVAGVEAIDTVFRRRYGAEVGPLERVDRVGLDTHLDSLRSLSDTLGPQFEPPPLLSTLVDAGQTGMAAGEGFYRWEDGEPVESALEDPAIPTGEDREP